jgi:hypothetical protein
MPHGGDALHSFACKMNVSSNLKIVMHTSQRKEDQVAPRTQAHFVSEHDVAVVIPIVHEPVKALQLVGPESVAVFESGGLQGLTLAPGPCEERHSMEQKGGAHSGDSVYGRHSSAAGRSSGPFDAGGNWLMRLNCATFSSSYRNTRHTPHATRHTPHATRHTPHATRHTPHATRHTPHATRHTPH